MLGGAGEMKTMKKLGDGVTGLSVKEWCRQAGIGYSTFYVLPLALRPRRVKIGKREVVFETALAWLQRMEAFGDVETLRTRHSS